jgi:hypothetical protein
LVLVAFVVRLRKDDGGRHLRVKGCFSDTPRAFLTEDLRNIREVFLKMLDRSAAKIMTGYATDLIMADGLC